VIVSLNCPPPEVKPGSQITAVAIVGAGDIVLIDPVNDAPLLPRGPELGPRARSGSRPAIEVMPDEIARLATAPRTWFTPVTEAVRDLRARLAHRAHSVRDTETRALLLALLFGDTSELPIEMPDLFVRTGTFHVLAVSGMQVVLVVLLLIGPASRLLARALAALTLGRVRATSSWFALPLVVLLVPVAGAGAPIVRSVMGAALSLVAPAVSRRRAAIVESGGRSVRVRLPRRADSLSFWSLALIVECVLHPDAPLSLSVQLSYAATLGLIVGTRPFLALLRAWIGPPKAVSGVTRTGRERGPVSMMTRLASARLSMGAVCAVAASMAAVAATLPFVWSRLSEWSPWGILATPVLAPSMTALLGLGWLRVLLGGVVVPDSVLVPCARAMTASMRAFDVLPLTPTPLPPRPGWLVALACLATFHALSKWTQAPSREESSSRSSAKLAPLQSAFVALTHAPWIARVAAFAWIALLVPWSATPARVQIQALDVGAGTAVVIEGPGLGTWVFDAGSRDRPDVAREALGPLLRRLDPGPVGIVLSHSDRDHESALPWLVERFPPRAFAGALPAHLAERLPHGCALIDLATGRARLPALSGGAASVDLWRERALDVEGNEG
jgi:competence protein ComEC